MTHAPVARLRRGALTPGGPASSRTPAPRLRGEDGVTTAEYAVVAAAGCGFGGVLLKLLTSDWGQSLLKKLFEAFLAMIGFG